jgi:hypothetical protein
LSFFVPGKGAIDDLCHMNFVVGELFAAAALREQLQPGDVILHSNKLTFFPMYYYDRTLAQAFIADPLGAGSDTLAYPTQQALQLYATDLEAATSDALNGAVHQTHVIRQGPDYGH